MATKRTSHAASSVCFSSETRRRSGKCNARAPSHSMLSKFDVSIFSWAKEGIRREKKSLLKYTLWCNNVWHRCAYTRDWAQPQTHEWIWRFVGRPKTCEYVRKWCCRCRCYRCVMWIMERVIVSESTDSIYQIGRCECVEILLKTSTFYRGIHCLHFHHEKLYEKRAPHTKVDVVLRSVRAPALSLRKHSSLLPKKIISSRKRAAL